MNGTSADLRLKGCVTLTRKVWSQVAVLRTQIHELNEVLQSKYPGDANGEYDILDVAIKILKGEDVIGERRKTKTDRRESWKTN